MRISDWSSDVCSSDLLLRAWPARRDAVLAPVNAYSVRGKPIRVDNYTESLSHQQIPKIAPPLSDNWGEQRAFLMRENLPGDYPYTGGVYPYRRAGEDPDRKSTRLNSSH